MLRPVELAACSIGRPGAVVVDDCETNGETARVVVLGDSLRSEVVDDVRGVVVVGDVLRAVVVGAVDPEPLALVVVERAATLVVVGAVVVELRRAVVLVSDPTVVLGSASGAVVVGMGKPWAAAGDGEGTSASTARTAMTNPTTTAPRCRSPTLGMVRRLPHRWWRGQDQVVRPPMVRRWSGVASRGQVPPATRIGISVPVWEPPPSIRASTV